MTLRSTLCGCRVVKGNDRWQWHPYGAPKHKYIASLDVVLQFDQEAIEAYEDWEDLPYEC